MKKMLKHFFQTAVLIALAWLIILLPDVSWLSYLNIIIWGLVAAIVVFMGIYLYREHKKGLLALVGAMFLVLSHPVFAYQQVNCSNETGVSFNHDAESCSGTGCEYHKCMVEAYRDKADYCSLKSNFDVDKAVKGEAEAPRDEDVKNAVKYLDAYDRAATAGCVEKSGALMEGLTLGLISDDDEDKRDCAEDYLEKVAEYKKKKAELETRTVYQILQTDQNKCWPCSLIHIMVIAIEKLALSMEDELSKAALMLLGAMFLFYLLFKVLLLIGQFGTANNAEFFTDLLTRFILAVIAVALLSGPMGVIYRLTFSSLLDVTLRISAEVIAEANSTNSITGSNSLSEINGVQGIGSQLVDNQYLECACCTNSGGDCNGGQVSECRVQYTGGASYEGTGFTDDEVRMLFPKEEKQALMCLTCKVYKETAPFVAAGRVLVYHAWENKTKLTEFIGYMEDLLGVHIVSYIPNPISMWFIGMTLIICFSWIAYVIAFKLLDIFLRIGFVIILTPFLLTAFVFPISRQYTKRGWDFLAHALLSIFAVSMGIALFMAAFKESLPNGMVSNLKEVFTIPDVGSDNQGYPGMLMDALGAGDEGNAFYTFLMILLVCFCGINVLQASQVIIEGLSGLTCGIPAISGVAVVGAIRAALAPFRMLKNIAMDKLNPGLLKSWRRAKEQDEKEQEHKDNPNDYQPGAISKFGAFVGNNVRKGGDKAAEAAGKATETAAQTRGKAAQSVGKPMMKAGIAGIKGSIAAAPETFGLSLLAVPLCVVPVVVGGAVYGAGLADEKTAKIQGKAVKTVIKSGSRALARGIKKTTKGAQRLWNKFKRKVVNRIKQIPAKIKNMPKNIKKKFLKATRRMRARQKYRHQKKTGHGPANWKRSDGSSNPKPKPQSESKVQDKDKDKKQSSDTDQPKKDTLGRKILRGALNTVDRADEQVDNALDGVENSFGDGGNRVLPDTNSNN